MNLFYSVTTLALATLLTNTIYAQDNNVKFGPGAGGNIQNSGAANVMIGNGAGYHVTHGIVNVMIGNSAGANAYTGNYNTYIGNGAGASNPSGSYNTFIGDGSGYKATGNFNMMLGVHAGFENTSGDGNVMIGGDAGKDLVTGSNNLFIGTNANVSQGIGTITNAIAIGNNALVTQSNTFILGSGVNVGIGTSSPQHKLSVNGTIGAREVKVTASGWADFVFAKDYKLNPLTSVERYIKAHKHLPGVPVTAQVETNGIDLGTTQTLLLQKIEELTLYAIQQQNQIKHLRKQVNQLLRR